MLTDCCRAQSSETPCDQLSLAEMSFAGKYSFIAPGSRKTHSAPGYRFTKYITPSKFHFIDFAKYIQDRGTMKAHAVAAGRAGT